MAAQATKLEKLMFAIGVTDQASGGIAKLQRNIQASMKKIQGHFQGIGTGALALVGVGMSVKAMLGPAMEFTEALDEVAARGASADALKHLETGAKNFVKTYGGGAADIVRSAKDIQGAIGDLNGKELAAFTTASSLMVKGLQADAGAVNSYMAAMYNLDPAAAARMGKEKWVNSFLGKTAAAAKLLKVEDGKQWMDSLNSLGVSASVKGVSQEEQLAVMGNLQGSLGGSDAASKYSAFLNKALSAQGKLGMSFFDKDGKMKSMVDIIGQLQGKLGNLNSTKAQKALQEAFGEENLKFIQLMQGCIKDLPGQIDQLSKVKGMGAAEEKARKMTHAWDRAAGALDVLRVSFGQKMLPIVTRWIDKGTAQINMLNKWIEKYPNVARVVGKVVLAFFAALAVVALWTVAFHAGALAVTALKLPLKVVTGGLKLAGGAFKLLTGLVKVLCSGFMKLAAVLWANPIFLIVLGVLALIAAVAALVYYWNDVKAYLADTSWGGPLLAIMEELEAGWNMLTDLFTDFTWTKLLKLVITAALKPLEYFIKALGKLADALGFDVGKKMMAFSAAGLADEMLGGDNGTAAALNSGKMLPKAAYAPAALGGMPVAAQPYRPEIGSLKQLRTPNTDDTRALAAQVSNRTNNNGRVMNVGEQHLHFENPPQNMQELMAMGFR